MFERRNDGNHVAPHNLSIYTQGVSSLFTYEPAKRPFQFTDEPLNRGTDVSGITINYREKKPRFISSYEYDPSTGLYTRYRENVPYIDGISGETCRYSNVIVLYTRVDWYNGAQSRPVIRLIGQGTADIFQNGKWIRGSWVRGAGEGQQYEMDEKALDGRMVFFDESGKELTFQRGKTFIQIVDEHRLDVSVTTNEYIEGGNPQPTP
ncbi:MAG: DUF3048 C-terminal domain-containing protein, partial [Clostridia bacterium]|nr:DUF3048 C-terminal domain-containing protein [Clostridia bacterium]